VAVPQTFKKSGVVYVFLGIGTLVALAIPGVVVVFTDSWVRLGFIIFGLIIVARAIYMLFYLRTVRWELRNDEIVVMEGILPWRKHFFDHPYETIFEAYFQHGFFGHFLNYGTCSIRRAEGQTTTRSESHMHDAKTLVSIVNAKVAAVRATARAGAPVAVAAGQTGVESLTELARLRSNGDISADEYEVMKGRLIGALGTDVELPPATAGI
jgi:hypothetical protein